MPSTPELKLNSVIQVPSTEEGSLLHTPVYSTRRLMFKTLGQIALYASIALTLLEMLCRLVAVYGNFPESYALKAFERKYEQAAALSRKQAPDVILLGDSQMDFDLYPELLSRHFFETTQARIRTVNLASPSATPTMSLALLRKVIASGAHPKLLVMNVNVRHFDREILNNPSKTIEGNLSKSYLGQCRLQKPSEFSAQIRCGLSRNLYMVRYRNQLKDLLMQTDKLFLSPDKLQATARPHEIYPAAEVSPNGWAPGYSMPVDETDFLAFSRSRSGRSTGAGKNYQWQETNMQAILDYCRSQNIKLVLIFLPLHKVQAPNMAIQPDLFSARVARFSQQNHVTYLDWHHLYSDYKPFLDGDHLNVVGAIDLTRKLSEFIGQQAESGLASKLSTINQQGGNDL